MWRATVATPSSACGVLYTPEAETVAVLPHNNAASLHGAGATISLLDSLLTHLKETLFASRPASLTSFCGIFGFHYGAEKSVCMQRKCNVMYCVLIQVCLSVPPAPAFSSSLSLSLLLSGSPNLEFHYRF